MIGWALKGHEASETLPNSYFLPLLLLQVGLKEDKKVDSYKWAEKREKLTIVFFISSLACLHTELSLGSKVIHSASCLKSQRHDAAECDPVCPDASLFHCPHLPKGQGRGTLISLYPLYPSDCPTLTPPRLSAFALAPNRTSVTAPATAARSLPPPILPQAC